MTEEELKQFIKENVSLTISIPVYDNRLCIDLRFFGDDEPFAKDYVSLNDLVPWNSSSYC